MRPLWVTSFARDMWDASGKALLASFAATKSAGSFFVGTEGINPAVFAAAAANPAVCGYDLDADPFLPAFLAAYKAVIPVHLGGAHPLPDCRCRSGPFPPHDKRHKMPCIGHWFNKNFFRWFRKIVTLKAALPHAAAVGADAVIWVDADCTFLRQVPGDTVASWFGPRHGCFYFQSTRPVLEGGVVGYHLADGGRAVLDAFISRYATGAFRGDLRWDDSYQLQVVIQKLRGVVAVADLAKGVGPHAGVVEKSRVGRYIAHKKGHHGRGLGIMT